MGQHRMRGCTCFIVPPGVLQAYARDERLGDALRQKFRDTFAETMRLKKFREAGRLASLAHRTSVAPAGAALAGAAVGGAPDVQVYDCQQRQSLPGRPAANPQSSSDPAVSTIYATTQKVAEFYRTVLSRNSVDNNGLDLVSSVHYQQNYDNAFWNGQQMVYGDGDGTVFTEFYKSSDVIGHELTHGVTQNESGLLYEGESGALNESISDSFGAVFNQWLNGWPASTPEGWLIGAGIMGSQARARNKTCLRDMNDPAGDHCLSPQPASYKQFDPTGDVHFNSGIPNKAFALFAQASGGNAWERAIKVWYSACTNRKVSSGATFVDFAAVTIEAASAVGSDVADQLKQAWAAVDLPLDAATS
jgi:Zn-dependent metalloprotease